VALIDRQLSVGCIAGENFVNEPGGLFEEPPTMVAAVTDPVGPVDTAVAQQKNGNCSSTLLANRSKLMQLIQALLYICSH